MRISDGRINYLSRRIAEALVSGQMAGEGDPDRLSREVKRGLNFYIQQEAAIDQKVRKKIGSLRRGVPEGSDEWDILYRQYYEEEMEKNSLTP